MATKTTSLLWFGLLLTLFASFSIAKQPNFHKKAHFDATFPFDVNNRGLATFFEKVYRPLSSFKSVNQWFTGFLSGVTDYVKPFLSTKKTVLENNKDKRAAADAYPYWKFIPEYIAQVTPQSPSVSWSAPCFTQSSAKAVAVQNGADVQVKVTLVLEKPSSLFCYDYYLFATMSGLTLDTFLLRGEHTVELNFKNMTEADKYDLTTNGVRIFRFIAGEPEAVESLYQTAMLFVPALLNQAVPEATQQHNLNFLSSYAGLNLEKRTITDVPLNESEIHSGDFFGVLRLDGLDPMLAWGMGAGTGHTTVALWIDGALYICESTTKSKYWPTDGIQKTPYQQWIKQAKAASYNVVHLPLSAEARAKFDEKKAVEWFHSKALGLPYGFHNMLFTWLDTAKDNLPCLPPGRTLCLSPQLVQILAGLVDKYDRSISQLMFNQALNKRVGHDKPDLSTVEVMYEAGKQGLNWTQLTVIPEQDEWVYNDGYSMVCDVLVCETWKAGGLFGAYTDQIQCTEFTNWDAYSLNIFDTTTPRAAACDAADPGMPYCQILGDYRMVLTGYNSKNPFPHMAEKCPSLAPDYNRPADC
eukprot:TRINITY_DN1261_c0_g1_i7.p1 TRINITY_DN1261_c0_g1~~TRINITY_DN1261_c0_g1_i7.p1  ORF type:complete len:600 (-),score=151.32 TRINITY_DN1261_c0_g1_i7:101-1849(-)